MGQSCIASNKHQFSVLADRDCSVRPTSQTETLRLKTDILCDYDTTVRPVLHHGTQTTVLVSMFLRSITFVSNLPYSLAAFNNITCLMPLYQTLQMEPYTTWFCIISWRNKLELL